ncbi:MAG: ABC transporter permease [Clostridiales bacterium]|nr:ABC transporter permease [Clostridiales bacterium]
MVKLLFFKMLRDLRRLASTYLICALIIAIGFTGYSVMSISLDQLTESRDILYEATAFSEVFAELYEAPIGLAGRLAQIEGVERVQGRIVKTVPLSGKSENSAELKLISYVEGGLNFPLLSRGSLPGQGEDGLVVGDGFFEARGLAVGDTVSLDMAGQPRLLTITGSGISPENSYMVKDIIDMLPDNAQYDAGFVRHDAMERLFSMEGRVNDIVLTLSPGTTFEEVEDSLRRVLEPFGLIRLYDRDGQVSSAVFEMEIDTIGRIKEIIPALFLCIAAVILYISLSRLIEQHRTQIGTLMALGFDKRTISTHYMCYAALVGFVGGLLGGFLGNLVAIPMTDLYQLYFRLPEPSRIFSLEYLLIGALMATLFCALVGRMAVRASSRLEPAEALRPAPPKSAKTAFFERIPKVMDLFTVPGVIALRSLVRNKRRSLLSILGIAGAYMITSTLLSVYSLFDVFLFDYLEETQRQDITVAFERPVLRQDATRVIRDSEIVEVQGVVDLPATLYGTLDKMDCTILGIARDSGLTKLYDARGAPVLVEDNGLVITELMADNLGLSIGSTVEVEVAYPKVRRTSVPVVGVVAQYLGANAYMSHEGIGRISDFGQVYTSVLVRAPEAVRDRLLTRLQDADYAGSVQSRTRRVEEYRGMMSMVNGMLYGVTLIGVAMGVAVVYVSSIISYEELKREIATMLALGLDFNQCLEVISTGQWILTCLGILAGIPLTFWASRLIASVMKTELFSIPAFVKPPMLLLGMLLTFVAVLVGSGVIYRNLKKISPVDLLRERE